MTWLDRVHVGDCREVMARMEAASVDAVVTDPPYELGFMGKAWDRSGVAFDVETWRQALRVLKPGGHLVAFAGTRTYHRMACAIEDAGFEIRDQLAWVYGSGFPKSKNLDGDWQGWGTALKPAWEPIVLARKPLQGSVAANVLAHGTGALNIDGCRVGERERPRTTDPKHSGHAHNAYGAPSGGGNTLPPGRWPANLAHDGSPEVLAAFPDAPGQLLPASTDADSRKTQNVYGAMKRGGRPGGFGNVGAPNGDPLPNGPLYTDSGSAARFFYCAKASREDRNAGLDGMPQKALNWSSGDKNPGSFQSPNTTREVANHHPTVKPTDLMRWLCRLITPPGGVILDPFAGSGSTLKAAELEQFRFIGIELSEEYAEIARLRIAADAPLFRQL